MPDKKLSLDEALALLDKHAAEDEAKIQIKKKKKVKALIKKNNRQALSTNVNTRRLLDQIEGEY